MEQKSKSGEEICAVCTTMRVCDHFNVKIGTNHSIFLKCAAYNEKELTVLWLLKDRI